ncbi:MAG: arginine deiminase [Porticoccaceae bacterium]|jgi:arginine deiminase
MAAVHLANFTSTDHYHFSEFEFGSNIISIVNGVYLEVGKLRRVIVNRRGLAHQRLTPGNCEELLFDNVFWVEQAARDHEDFCTLMREWDIDVLDCHELLSDISATSEARNFLLDKRID